MCRKATSFTLSSEINTSALEDYSDADLNTYNLACIVLEIEIMVKLPNSHNNFAHLRLHDGDDAVHLADGGVPGQHVCILRDGEVAGSILANLENAAPLSEVAAILLVLGASLVQVV